MYGSRITSHIPCTQPSSPNAATGDPSMALVTPVEQWSRAADFSTIGGHRDTFARLTWDTASVSSVLMDGSPVTGSTLVGSTIAFANVPVAAGDHQLTTVPAGSPVGVELYGYTSYASYATMGPRQFETIAPTLQP